MSLVDQHEEPVFEYLRTRAGLSFAGLRRNGAANAVSRLQRRLDIQDQREFVRRLIRDNNLFESLIAEVTVGETYFFRHRSQLEAIRTVILPSLARERPADHVYRLWSAGCSTGEEAYSLAILTDQEGLISRTSILATDISKPALKRAERAEYSGWSFRGLEKSFVRQYFNTKGKTAVVTPRIRKKVNFRVLNLALADYPSPESGTSAVDLILCRNVLIYFDGKAVAETAARLYASLAPGGWLVMGPSDPPLWHHVPLTPILLPGAVIYKRERQRSVGEPSPYREGGGAAKAKDHSSPARLKHPNGRAPVVKKAKVSRPMQSEAVTGSSAYDQILKVAQTKGVADAEEMATARLTQDPFAVELRYLRSVLLMSMNRDDEAIAELRRLIYSDRSHAAAHFALGSLFHKKRDLGRARRSFTNAYRIATTLPPGEEVPMAEGMTAGELASIAKQRLLDLAEEEAL